MFSFLSRLLQSRKHKREQARDMLESMLRDDDDDDSNIHKSYTTNITPTFDEVTQNSDSKDDTAHLIVQNENLNSILGSKQRVESSQNQDKSQKSWEKDTETKLNEVLKPFSVNPDHYLNEQLRNILGIITQRLPSAIEVDTGNSQLTVELDSIETNFIPKTGDYITLECEVQPNEGYGGQQGNEILNVKKIFPTCIEPNQKCTVEGVFEQFSELTYNTYVLKEDIPNGVQLHLGDIVKVDLIECKYSNYAHRAIGLSVLQKNFDQKKKNLAIVIDGEDRFVYAEQWTKHEAIFKVKNQGRRTFVLNSIEIRNSDDSQIRLVEPIGTRCIYMNDQISVIFEIHTKYLGESTESFTLNFDAFKLTRSLTIIVCISEDEALEVKRKLTASKLFMVGGRDTRQLTRRNAYKVFSQKSHVIPGESLNTKRRFVRVNFAGYEVPEKMFQIVLTSEPSQVKNRLFAQYPFLNENLTYANYGQRFAAMLHLEEIEYNINFRNYDRKNAHFNREGEYLSLDIENLAERRPSIVLGDTVNAINPDGYSKENTVFQGFVHKVFFDRILLKFNATFQQQYNGEDYHLEFHFSRFAIRKQHHVISRICERMGENFLFPTKISKREDVQLEVTFKDDDMYLYDNKLPWFNSSLNSIQKMAVYNILRGETENMPYVLFGPPGTGKTSTLVETILQLVSNVPGARLLVGTPSNSSADLLTKLIIANNVVTQNDLIRLVSQNQVQKDLIPPVLASYCGTVDMGSPDSSFESMVVSESGIKLRCQAKFLSRHRIIISTCMTLGNLICMDFQPEHFTHVLIDEAGQCTEPETMMPIMLLAHKSSQVILAGDPHQLQSVVTSRYASDLDLGVSFLERLFQTPPYRKDIQRFPHSCGYNPIVLTKLLNNYRALPSVLAVYSKLFYDNEIISMVSEHDSRESRLLAELQDIFEPHREIPPSHGTFFHGIMGENMQDIDSPSWYNKAEANEVFRVTILLYRCNILPEQIGILTPYTKQVKTLRNMFSTMNVAMPRIGSVEEFQGQERDIMLISTVRSSESILQSDACLNLGFVQCKKRMNVAISRARCLMVIFGNPYLLAVDDCWRQLILFCAKNNAYFGCDIPPSIVAQMEESNSTDFNTYLDP